MNIHRAIVFAITTLSWPMAAFAQGITDPTRPPPSVLSFMAVKPGATPAPASTGPENNVAGPRMVTIGPAKKYALIGGKVVRLGETIEGAKLVEVRPNSVVLQSPEGTKETVDFYPGITIKRIEAESAAPPKSARDKESAKGRKKENK